MKLGCRGKVALVGAFSMIVKSWGLLRDFEIFASFRIAFVSSSNVYLDQHLRGGLEVLDGHAGAVVPAGGDPLVVGHLGQGDDKITVGHCHCKWAPAGEPPLVLVVVCASAFHHLSPWK